MRIGEQPFCFLQVKEYTDKIWLWAFGCQELAECDNTIWHFQWYFFQEECVKSRCGVNAKVQKSWQKICPAGCVLISIVNACLQRIRIYVWTLFLTLTVIFSRNTSLSYKTGLITGRRSNYYQRHVTRKPFLSKKWKSHSGRVCGGCVDAQCSPVSELNTSQQKVLCCV